MNLFEFEGKQIMREHKIPVPESFLITSPDEPAPMEYPFVLKAQVMTGGRGKAGGVKVCANEEEYSQYVKSIMSMEIKGHQVHGILAEKLVSPIKELYLSVTLEGTSVPVLIASRRGGMDIEKVSLENPEDIIKIEIDTFTGLKDYQMNYIASKMEIEDKKGLIDLLNKVQEVFFKSGARLVEINPLGVTDNGFIAMDSKIALDDNCVKMKPVITQIEEGRQKLYNYCPPEKEETTITYVPLNGDIGLISDGAGTGMLTLDLINDAGGSVASFCELGGMTSPEVMYRAMELTLTNHPEIKGVIIVLIGGFNRMDNMAVGITEYVKKYNVKVPVFTRMCGTEEETGLEIMKNAGMQTYSNLTETVCELVKSVREA